MTTSRPFPSSSSRKHPSFSKISGEDFLNTSAISSTKSHQPQGSPSVPSPLQSRVITKDTEHPSVGRERRTTVLLWISCLCVLMMIAAFGYSRRRSFSALSRVALPFLSSTLTKVKIYQNKQAYSSLFSSVFTYELDVSSSSSRIYRREDLSSVLCSRIRDSLPVSTNAGEYTNKSGNIYQVTLPKLYLKETSPPGRRDANRRAWLVVCGGGYFSLTWKNEVVQFLKNSSSAYGTTTDVFALKYSTPGAHHTNRPSHEIYYRSRNEIFYTRNTDSNFYFLSSSSSFPLLSYQPFAGFQESIRQIAALGYTSLDIISFSAGSHLTALMLYTYGNQWMPSLPPTFRIRSVSFHYPYFMYTSPSYRPAKGSEQRTTSSSSSTNTEIEATDSQPIGYFTLTYPSSVDIISTAANISPYQLELPTSLPFALRSADLFMSVAANDRSVGVCDFFHFQQDWNTHQYREETYGGTLTMYLLDHVMGAGERERDNGHGYAGHSLFTVSAVPVSSPLVHVPLPARCVESSSPQSTFTLTTYDTTTPGTFDSGHTIRFTWPTTFLEWVARVPE